MLSLYLNLLDTEEEKSKFEKLYYEYRKIMKHQALEILKDDGLAEDAVHDAFIKLTRYLDGIKEIESHKTKSFLIIIVRSVSLDMQDKLKRRPAVNIQEIEKIPNVNDAVFEKNRSAGASFKNQIITRYT